MGLDYTISKIIYNVQNNIQYEKWRARTFCKGKKVLYSSYDEDLASHFNEGSPTLKRGVSLLASHWQMLAEGI